jgi:ribulose 1,5-bisphosphate synthetase/thiazole synthase
MLVPQLSALALFSLAWIVVAKVDVSKYTNVIHRDVAIIGGGASGAHAAVRLREDFKKSVVVVERQGILVSRPL